MRIETGALRLLRVAAIWLSMSASACSLAPSADWPTDTSDLNAATKCGLLHAQIAAAVEESGTRDAEATEIPGFPFLRTNRFLTSFADADLDDAGTRAWIGRMRDLATDSTAVEFGNLPIDAKARLNSIAVDTFGSSTIEAAADCSAQFERALIASPNELSRLRNSVEVPDHYNDAQRFVGLYSLTALPVAIGYDQWRTANLGTFSGAPGSLAAAGERIAYRSTNGTGALSVSEAREILERSRINPLNIPDPTADDARLLFDAFAPVWMVDTIGPDDRPGALSWRADETLIVERDRPVTYHKLTWTRFGGDILLQLNYLVWFPARPKTGPLDLLGGALDGVVWRVTLGADGRPIMYDSIHACGCYHLFFPVPPLVPRAALPAHDIRERAESPASGPDIVPGQQIAVWLAGNSHYIQAVTVDGGPDTKIEGRLSYALTLADDLRRLMLSGGETRSIYGPDGIVAGTERLERFLLWPMGIASPGAMRQWGTHATAFIGRRHFDDPYLFDTAFRDPTRERQ